MLRPEAGEIGMGRPAAMAVLAAVLLFIFLAVRVSKGAVIAREFEQEVRKVVVLNPMMKDEEFKMRLGAAAKRLEVDLDLDAVRVERGAATALSSGGISKVHVHYVVSTPLVVTTWKNVIDKDVEP